MIKNNTVKMHIAIDIGNTQAKLGIFKSDELKKVHSILIDNDYWKLLNVIKSGHKKMESCIVSSVRDDSNEFISEIKKYATPIVLNNKLKLPFKNLYKTPATLGNDRIANAAAACTLFPKKNILTIDTGTCIKFDFVDAEANYHGGSISPGLQMRFQSLHQFTGKLPLIKSRSIKKLIGSNTEESILSGVQNGIVMEVEGMISEYQSRYKNLTVILTGGDLRFFGNHLKTNIFARPNFTLLGLHAILKLNL